MVNKKRLKFYRISSIIFKIGGYWTIWAYPGSYKKDMRKQGVIKEKRLREYFGQQNDIELAILFGSAAMNRTTPMSDIDIGVYFKNGEDTLKLGERQIDITCAMMKLYHINRVDVIILNLANPFLRFQVVKYGRLIYAKDEKEFYKFKAVSLGRYQDIRPMYELYDSIAENRLRRGLNG